MKQLRKEYLEINAMAKPEIARFHRQRIFTLKDSMKELAESEVCDFISLCFMPNFVIVFTLFVFVFYQLHLL